MDAMMSYVLQGLGLLALLEFGRLVYRQLKVREWPKVEGVILSSEVTTDADLNHYPAIRYEYRVGSRTFQNDKVYPRGVFSSPTNAVEKMVERYAPGTPVLVAVDPENPADSALETVMPAWGLVMVAVAGLAFLFIGAQFR